MISEKMFENNNKINKITDKTNILNNDLGYSLNLLNDIDRMTNKRKYFYYVSFLVLLFLMTVAMIWRFFHN